MPNVLSTAALSECGTFRHSLTREWEGSRKVVAFIGMNPSTADASTDDPTIRRCMNFVSSWGASKLIMVNLFAYRSTDPDVLLQEYPNVHLEQLIDTSIETSGEVATDREDYDRIGILNGLPDWILFF